MFKVMQWEARTLRWWLSQRDKIDMSPPYQRGGNIWSKSDKQFLIDSILNDFDIPKIYIADFAFARSPLNVRNLTYAIIDGKQRFEALYGFFKDEFSLQKEIVYEEDPKIDLGGLTYSQLRTKHPEIAEKFDNFNLTVMRVVTDDEAKINDLFVRLNTSKPLTGAELRNAMTGLVTTLTRRISEHEFFTKRITFSAKRQEQLNASGKLLLIEFRGRLVDTKKKNLDNFVVEGQVTEASQLNRAAERVESLLTTMCRIFREKDPLLGGSGAVPVYYWFVRTVESERHGMVRRFLEEFAATQTGNPPTQGPFNDASIINQYKIHSRSANDATSLEERFKILMQFFGKWVASRPA